MSKTTDILKTKSESQSKKKTNIFKKTFLQALAPTFTPPCGAASNHAAWGWLVVYSELDFCL